MVLSLFFLYNGIKGGSYLMMKKLSVLQKLTFSYCLLVLGIMVLTGIFILPIALKGLDRNLESNISNTASMLSYDPEIINGLNKKHFSKDLINRMDTLFKQSPEDVDYLVIATADSIRVYHLKHDYIGKHFTGNDEKNILNGAIPYITTRQGNKDIQKRAFHAIKNKSGKIIGFIMVSASLQTIRYQQHKLIAQF